MSDDIEEVVGPDVTIRFEAKRCIHSRHCVLSRPDVFVPNVKGEWIHPEAATADEVAELAHNCPSGAIQYIRHDGKPAEAPPKVNLVEVRENGPLAFHGEFALAGHGTFLRATLCRCGASKTKPFCDNSHTAKDFKATGEPPTKETQPLTKRDGAVTIRPAEDGPLIVAGNVEVVTGTGRTVVRCLKAAFCRCGGSKTKPFCDGTHLTIDFQAPAGE